MNTEHRWIRILAFVLIAAGPIAGFLIIWYQLTAEEQWFLRLLLDQHPASILSTLFVLVAALAGLLLWIFRHYVDPARKMAEETQVISTTNPSHRITGIDRGDMGRLAHAINESAERFEQLSSDVAGQIRQSNADLEREKNTLATLIQELTDGILVCTIDGQILLYNRQATRLISREGSGGMVGLGRSVFGCIDRALIAHVLEESRQHDARDAHQRVSHFVTTGAAGQLLRVQVIPLLEQPHQMSGFILVMDDITQRIEHDSRRDYLLQSLTEGIRTSLTRIRIAAESWDRLQPGDAHLHRQYLSLIREEALSLSNRVDKTVTDSTRFFKSQWPLEDILCMDILSALKRSAEQTLDVHISIITPERDLWATVDSYSLLQALLFLVNELKRGMGIIDFTCRATRFDSSVDISINWKGPPFPAGRLQSWKSQTLIFEGHGVPSTLGDVLKRHGATLRSREEPDHRGSALQLLLPSAPPTLPVTGASTGEILSRPEFYDFDLFKRVGQNPATEQRLLSDLVYTAFDTETTGLNPTGGDEIISIAGVRIVNRRILREETLDELINPLRHLTRESMQIHGIRPDMLKDQPTIDRILPAFQRFAEGTVLVAHNAAFDLRFFQLKEESTGVRLENPVLDTLILSSVVHPHQEGHGLEDIAKRLGVDVIGRHTALGDALVTAEVFVRLLPLLEAKGIRTLNDAFEASKDSYYARIRY